MHGTLHDIWDYPGGVGAEPDIAGFIVETSDGTVGTVDPASYTQSASFLVIDTGRLLPHRVEVPGSWLLEVDAERQAVRLDCTRNDVKHAPPHHG